MTLTPELLGTGIVGLIIILGAIGNYLRTRDKPPQHDASLVAGIGIGWGDREQVERMIALFGRIATALEILADRRTEEMEEIHRTLLDRLDARERREEHEEQRPRRR
jgi:hypothetical protein